MSYKKPLERPNLDYFKLMLIKGRADEITAQHIEELIEYIEYIEWLDKEVNRRF